MTVATVHLHLLGPLELTSAGGRDERAVLSQPKRLAVLAFLAARPAGEFVRRDTLIGTFWPEQSQHAARRSLRQTLHFLRSRLGSDIVLTRGDDEAGVDPAALECDVVRFLADLREGHSTEALHLYRGDLLAGFYLSGGTAEFERWLESERARLASLAAQAATSLAREAERSGDLGTATGWARRALAIAPDDEIALRRLLELLERSGDRAGALRLYDAFARRLSRELDYEPAPETLALVARLRASAPAPAAAGTPAREAALPAPPPADESPRPGAAVPASAADLAPPARSRRWIAGIGTAAAVVLLVGATTLLLNRRTERPVIAVGDIRDGNSSDPELATRILPELLATDLARIAGLPVVPPTRIEQVAGYLRTAGRPATVSDAALAAGATDLVEGAVYRIGADSLRLDFRLADARSGVVRDAVTLQGVNAFALADSAAVWLADRYSLERPSRPLAEVTSASATAQVLYQEGLKAFYRDQDDEAAARLFGDAVAADSTFAMAAYYLSVALGSHEPERGREALELADRMAAHATQREALLIHVAWAEERGDAGWPALADSFAALFPHDPQSRILAGTGHTITGDFPGAVEDLTAAIHLDSLSLGGASARCLACDAYRELTGTYLSEDSLPAALAAARQWVAAQPRSASAWNVLSVMLERANLLDSALAAYVRANVLVGHPDAATELIRARYAILEGRLPEAEALVAGPASDPRDPQHAGAEWWQLLALRNAGRPGAAVALARRLAADTGGRTYNENSLVALPLGQVLFESGRLVDAGRIFDSAGLHSAQFRAAYPGQAENDRAWALAQRAAVAAAQRDTAALARLADSVAVHARATPWGRDRRLASWVRGLKLEVTGQLAPAADTFRNAVYSPTQGYTRVNLELARTLLALGRPADALPWLRAALTGGLDGSNFYVTRGELESLAGDAFAALGRRDSAAAHYAWVARAWRDAEPPFQARLRAAERYLADSAGPGPVASPLRAAGRP